jgi:hypothetical protein
MTQPGNPNQPDKGDEINPSELDKEEINLDPRPNDDGEVKPGEKE